MLAIVIPYYNIEFFEQTLKSLVSQSDKNFQVYIGNDASDDDPKSILKSFDGQIDYEYKVFSNNLGSTSLASQWHRCLEMLNDEKWVIVLGDDDVLGNNVVESFYDSLNLIKDRQIKVVRYASQIIDGSGDKISSVYTHPVIESSEAFLERKMKGGTRSSLSEYCFERDQLFKIKFKDFPLAWYSDLLAVLEVSEFKNIYTINEAVVYFRWSGKNITSRIDNHISKNEATFSFYLYVIKKYDDHINQELLDLLHNGLEKTFLDHKKRWSRWLIFTTYYIRKAYFARFSNFLLKCVPYLIRNRG